MNILKKILTPENLYKIKIMGIFAITFLVGFGTGTEYYKNSDRFNGTSDSHYTTNDAILKSKNRGVGEGDDVVQDVPKPCQVKGNIGSNGKKVYHIAAGQYYKKVTAEVCFVNEQEAKKAGFVKSPK